MSAGEARFQSERSRESALRVLEDFSKAAGIVFDRILALRVLGETEHAIAGTDASTWGRRLVDAGESVNLRIRLVDCPLKDVLGFVREGMPVAICLDQGELDSDSIYEPGKGLHWLVLSEVKGRKIRVVSLDDGASESWMSLRRLQKQIGLSSNSSPARWILGQAALACQAQTPSGGMQSGGKAPTPLQRLIGLVKPEKKDLWVVLVFSLVVGVLALATPVAVEALVNTVAFGQYLQPVVILALLLFTFLAFAAAMRGLITYVVEIFQRRLFVRVVEDLAYRLPRVKQEQFDSKHGPEAVNRFLDIVTVQKTSAGLLLDGITIVLQTVIGMAVLAFYHPFLLGFDVVLVASIGFIVFGLGRGAVQTAIKESKAKYAIAAWLEELARHPTAFKLHSGNQFALERADQLAIDWLNNRRAHFRVVMRQILFALGLQAVAGTALLGLGGWLVILGELTLGQLVAAELIVMMIVGSFAKLGKHMESAYDLLASVDKLGQLFDLEYESHDKLFHLREGEAATVDVVGASYLYDHAGGVSDCSFNLAAGDSVALTGSAGSGKSTIVDLMCGLRSPTGGHVELDGIDLRELRPDSLREHLAVARSIEIFHGTIGENVHLNRPNISAKDVRDALETVGLIDEVLSLPDGLNTVLQTNGSPLTQSQALRLMVARAVVGRPRLLLIDGTLDSLPGPVINNVLKGIVGKQQNWTVLVTTVRPEVIAACDRTVELDQQDDPGHRTPPVKLGHV